MSAYVRPATLPEAYAARAAHPDYVLLAGGTDLMVGAHHQPPPSGVIDVFGLEGLRGVERRDDRIRIGAGTTYADLLRSEVVRAELPSLHEACREVGAVQIQERGTLGGNMGTASPVGDTLPVLLAHDAEVELGSTRGTRRLPYADFVTGYRSVDLAPDELIAAVELPAPGPDLRSYWRKIGTRRAQAISKLMVAAAARLGADGRVEHVRLAMGAVAARPLRLPDTEDRIAGRRPDAALAEQVRAQVRREITPITDVRSTAGYRLEAAANLAARFVLRLAGGAG